MSDIDVIFASNASEVVGPINAVGSATVKAELASRTLGSTVRELGKHIHELGRVAGGTALHLGKALGTGGAVGVAIIGIVALHKALELADHFLDRNKEHAKAVGEEYLKMARNVKSATDSMGKTGLETESKQGQTIKKLIAQGGGGLVLANSISSKYGVSPEEAQKATIEAQKKFGAGAPQALEAAGRAFAAGGPDLSEGIKKLSKGSLAHGSNVAASKLFGSDITQAEKNISTSALGTNLQKIEGIHARQGIAGQEMVGQGVRSAAQEFSVAVNPLANLMTEQVVKQREELEVLKQVRDNLGFIATAYDKVRHPFANAGAKYSDALADSGLPTN